MLRHVKDIAIRLWNDEAGASLLEYSVLLGLITATCVGAVLAVGTWVTGRWGTVLTTLTTTNN